MKQHIFRRKLADGFLVAGIILCFVGCGMSIVQQNFPLAVFSYLIGSLDLILLTKKSTEK